MLKRLELVGFKSFADKTVFDFGDGITAIVGPNGSGKSNVVDAVRWILGEQSAKSLRGGEMTDVIFNGSTSRRSLGLAEVTMTFDNRRRSLATEAEEVQITRRVYRSGEGEYLINQQICRLKDIKDLFLGSGAGTDAYCIIEQGRVDVLLQASTKDRRTIFEEAAGISRFKARKTETLRKLERVDQNVQRLRDIIDEVEKQLRGVKLQAAKAQRYQEYTGRLKELRVGLGLQECHQLSGQLTTQTQQLEQQKADLEARTSQASGWESEAQRLEAALAELDEQLRGQEAELVEVRQSIKTAEGTLRHESAVSADLDAELTRTRTQLAELHTRVADLTAGVGQVRQQLTAAEAQGERQRQGVRALEDGLQAAVVRLAELQGQIQTDKEELFEQNRRATSLHNEAVRTEAERDNFRRERERLRRQTAQAAENLASLDVELEELTDAESALQRQLAGARQELAGQKQQRERFRQLHDETAELISRMRQQRSGLASRIEVLEGLERSHEGLGSGVQEVFRLLEQPEPGPWRNVLGMIADFLTVRREYAPLIDIALGDWSQRFLVRDVGLLGEALARRAQPFSGRVSFLPLHDHVGDGRGNGERRPNRLLEMSLPGRVRMPVSAEGTPAHPGVVAPAVAVVTCDHPELSDLPAQLLARTLIVRDLASARAIAAHTTGYRLVTLQGELLEPDGTLTVGTHHAETGILSRKSELRELRQQSADLDRRLAETEHDLTDLRERLAALDAAIGTREQEVAVLAEQSADLRARLEQHRDKRKGLHEEVTVSRDEIQRVEQDMARSEQAYQTASTSAAAALAQVQRLQTRIEQADREIRESEQVRQQRQQEYTHAKVALATVEERLTALRAQCQQRERDLQQRRAEHALGQQQVQGLKGRLVDSQRSMLAASAALAVRYLDKEAVERRVGALSQQRAAQRQERTRLANLAQQVRHEWRAQQEQVHARELQVTELRHRLGSLADRLREDYQLELSQLYQDFQAKLEAIPEAVPVDAVLPEGAAAAPPSSAAEADAVAAVLTLNPGEANDEIAELRKKLNRLGSVNLESLAELSELETRAGTLQAQYDDLAAAKKSLEEIIAKINTDSRKLFTETFATIRTHFQELFRKLFAGGMADIVLEDEADILESGIEIVARPPGKELRSISLMSGGEKTMTAVALLLAIFRSRPSPFCILDEVDAALDEANVGRFTAVLREFLVLSQFIIVTHSKKTMATADVLYGVTMQESGISKRVSVRFEDWPDDEAKPREESEVAAAG